MLVHVHVWYTRVLLVFAMTTDDNQQKFEPEVYWVARVG